MDLDKSIASTSLPASMVVPERVSTLSVVRYCEPGTKSLAKKRRQKRKQKNTNKANSLSITNTFNIKLFGELAALISLGIEPNDKHRLADVERVQVTLVAGVGFEPTTFRL